MKARPCLLLFVTPLLALGCVKSHRIGEPESLSVAPDRTYLHEDSGFVFPAEVAGLQRGEVTQFDVTGTDISVAYNSSKPPVTFTIYIYPIPRDAPKDALAWHFDYCKSEVVRVNHGARLLSENPITVSQAGSRRKGMRARYSFTTLFAGKTQPCRSELDLFLYEGRFVLYRMTFAESDKAVSQGLVEQLLDELAWPPASTRRM